MDRSAILTTARFGGGVKRYHTWPTIQSQTVADHSFHMLRIWLQIFGPPPSGVTTYIVKHDIGEVVVGDAPFPVKARNPALKKAYDAAEEVAVEGMKLPHAKITPYEQKKVKVCDLIEMMEFGTVEAMLGNRYAEPVIAETLQALAKNRLYDEDERLVEKYLDRIDSEGALPWKSFTPET